MLQMAHLLKNSVIAHRMPARMMFALSSVLFLFCAASDSYSQQSRDSDIAKALGRIVKCERIEIKTRNEDNKSGKMGALLIRLAGMSKHLVPADYVTAQYTNPDIDVTALKKSNSFNVKSYSNFKIGMLFSEQTIKNEFDRTAKRLNLHYNKLSIKLTPPYIEVEFDIPVEAIPLKNRKSVEKYVKNRRLEGYAALRLEVHDNKIFASPAKVILNHFLLPMPLVSELKKHFNPIYQVPNIRPFNYNLVKADILKQHILLSN